MDVSSNLDARALTPSTAGDGTPTRKASGAWWYWLLLSGAAIFNDVFLSWIMGQLPGAPAGGVAISLTVGALELSLLGKLLKRAGRYQHRSVAVAAGLLALMMAAVLAIGIGLLLLAMIAAPPDPS